ncbi:MAG: lipopolysaccharide biosynthesis protein [Myxococcaceae bacterium]|nr:lipopolysaccharide biosynthesis protein [Myxococcaceae bacterium]MCA3014667.1 lipopolysaccharide biosynthesis protein [Myxococcaceae bacterium]
MRSPTLLYTALAGLSRASSILMGPFLTRRLTTAQYGDLAFYQSTASVLSMLLSVGLTAAVSRFYFEGESREAALRTSGSIARGMLMLVVGGATVFAAVIAIAPLSPDTRHHLATTLLAAAGSALVSIPVSLTRARQLPLQVAAFASIEFGGLVLSTLALVGAAQRGLDGALEALALSGLLSGIAATAYVLLLPGALHRETLVRGLRFSAPFVPHFIANQLLTLGDRWFLKANGLENELGPYALASQLAAPIGLVVGAHNDTASARLGETVRTGGAAQLRLSFPSLIRSYLRLTAPLCGMLLIASPLVPWVFSSRFETAVEFLPLLLLSILIEAAYFPATNVLFFANATSRIPILTGISGVASIALNVLLIPRYGAWGALAARAVAMTLRTALALMFARAALRVTVQH